MKQKILALSMVVFLGSACEPPDTGEVDCDPADENCVCSYDDGETCEDPGDLDCSCTMVSSDEGTEGEVEPDEPEEERSGLSFRYVLIEDLTDPIGGDAPGADIDAVAVVKSNASYYATVIEDSNLGGRSNAFLDPGQLLGPPDSNCEKKNFTSLGGARSGGYVVVSFATDAMDVTIENGDTIEVFEIGRTLCPQTNYDDDPYRVSVSIASELGTFQEIGTGGEGINAVPVTGLQ
jgi:hypothetical protein